MVSLATAFNKALWMEEFAPFLPNSRTTKVLEYNEEENETKANNKRIACFFMGYLFSCSRGFDFNGGLRRTNF